MKQSRGWLSLQALALFPGQQVSFVAPLITVSLPHLASVCRIYYIHSTLPKLHIVSHIPTWDTGKSRPVGLISGEFRKMPGLLANHSFKCSAHTRCSASASPNQMATMNHSHNEPQHISIGRISVYCLWKLTAVDF